MTDTRCRLCLEHHAACASLRLLNVTRVVMRRHVSRDDLGTKGRGVGISEPLSLAETSPPLYLSLPDRVTHADTDGGRP